jgi:FlaA1/EpsC-like NDP-sugar epimerase
MRRYFMTIPEASQLVLQAFSFGNAGDVFLLDMGEPVKILDLATNLILLSGLKPERDIKIQFTGLRPGEKLFEELNLNNESLLPTHHPKIRRYASPSSLDFHQLKAFMKMMYEVVGERNVTGLVELLEEMIPDYTPSTMLLNLATYTEAREVVPATYGKYHGEPETSGVGFAPLPEIG